METQAQPITNSPTAVQPPTNTIRLLLFTALAQLGKPKIQRYQILNPSLPDAVLNPFSPDDSEILNFFFAVTVEATLPEECNEMKGS
ncbi:hypothetical protein [Tenuifilum thalassicum]|uniref:Uncharacterized protein n=1 Tax=Tenuifilum thalassicum TaxID=2590900 RepID=A0A7D4BEW7_9BACT|nr:hypothetical protein [Tenuifilum thalassicum]QKG81123.1 hypothetical protein FHG85_12885 [Tenuifilum thalassicum]